jgi:hypothetical protein
MSLDEAHQILNVKKDEPMDVIQKVGRSDDPRLWLWLLAIFKEPSLGSRADMCNDACVSSKSR